MISYDQLPSTARTWVYQCNRKLNMYELMTLRAKIAEFVGQWTSHKIDVKAWGDIVNDCFIVLMADESDFQVGGCSIDSSVHFIQTIDAEFNLDLFDRFAVAYRKGEDIEIATRAECEKLVAEGNIQPETIVFNNIVLSKSEFEKDWEIPFSDSWQSKVYSPA